MYTYIYVCIYTCICIFVCIYIHVYMYICTYVQTYMYTHVNRTWSTRSTESTCAKCPIYIFNVIHSYVQPWRIHMCDVTHSCVRRDSLICALWLIHTCDTVTPSLDLSWFAYLCRCLWEWEQTTGIEIPCVALEFGIMFRVLHCFIDPRVRKIKNEASSCPGTFSSRTYSPLLLCRCSPLPHLLGGHRDIVGCRS